MPASPAYGARAYRQVQVESSQSPLELIVMLYDGALASLAQARDAVERRDLVAKGRAMSKALSIVGHLQGTLNMEDGREIAQELDRLYLYVTERLLEANMQRTVEPIDDSMKVLGTLREAWAQIASSPVATP